MGGPEYEMAAGDGRGRLRASHADRERVIGTLKAAYVYGLVAKDELDESQPDVRCEHLCRAGRDDRRHPARAGPAAVPAKASTGKGQCPGSRDGPHDHGHRHSRGPGLLGRLHRESGDSAVCRRDRKRFGVLVAARYPDALAANPAPRQSVAAAAAQS